MTRFRSGKSRIALGLVVVALATGFGNESSFAKGMTQKVTTKATPATTVKPTLLNPYVALAKNVDAMFVEMNQKNHFSGSVLLAKNGKVLLNKGYGYANEEYKIANSPKTVYRMASLSKQLTAAAILKLEDSGKLTTVDPLSKFIPDFPRGDDITLEMLMQHTSGLRDTTAHTGLTPEELYRMPRTPKQLVELIRNEPLETEPGSTYFYSNHGYILLGYCIEKASGMPYDAYLKKALLDPMGIVDIQYDVGNAIVPNRAEGYKVQNGKKVKADWIDMSNPYSAGALIGTTESYLKWQQHYRNPKILSKSSWDKLFGQSVKTLNSPLFDENYGFGVMMTTFPTTSGKMVNATYHTGGVNGFRAFQIHIDGVDIDFILMSNNESLSLETLLFKIMALLLPVL